MNKPTLEHRRTQLLLLESYIQAITNFSIYSGAGRIRLGMAQSADQAIDVGATAHQVACCVASSRPLQPIRPTTALTIPNKLLVRLHIDPERLESRERPLVSISLPIPQSAQNGHLLAINAISGGEA